MSKQDTTDERELADRVESCRHQCETIGGGLFDAIIAKLLHMSQRPGNKRERGKPSNGQIGEMGTSRP